MDAINRDTAGKFTFKPGGVRLKGYPVVYQPNHPRAKTNGYVREHILIAEKILGRPLLAGEVIHHINEDKADNNPENLIIFASHKDHMKYHWMKRNPEKYRGQPLPAGILLGMNCKGGSTNV